jgi:hypothetical protein
MLKPGSRRSALADEAVPSHPAHVLYDGGCELLAAAQGLTASARRQGCGEAIPATLGCLGAALDELGATCDALAEEMRSTRTLSDRPATATMQALDRLTEALAAARDVCETARSNAAAARQGGDAPSERMKP